MVGEQWPAFPGSRLTTIRKGLKWKSNFTAFRSYPSVKVGTQTFTNSCHAFGRHCRKFVEYGNVWRWSHVGRQYRTLIAYGSSMSKLHIRRHCRKCVEYRCILSGHQYCTIVIKLPSRTPTLDNSGVATMVQMVQVLPPDRQGWLIQFVQIRWVFLRGLAIEMQLGAL